MSGSAVLPALAIALLALPVACFAQATAPSRPSLSGAKEEIPLYAGVAPGSEKWDYAETEAQGKSGPVVRNVVRPTLLYFPAARPVGTAMIVAPGGGTRSLMMSYEGFDIAKKLNEAGVDAFVLKYRLIQTGPGVDNTEPAKTGPQAGQNVRDLAAQDGARAVALVRSRAAEFKVRPDRIGMIGFSAGGGPIRGAMTGPVESRPDFAVLIYAAGSRDSAVTVPAGAPPLFLAVASDDPHYEASLATFAAWRKASLPVELHVFQMGAHGFVNKGGGADRFMDRVAEWMQLNGWLPKAP
jgi:acetyl esterase/lipase